MGDQTAPILICGAGISGLALAQALSKRGIPFRVFERDPTLNFRAQGYRVRINGDGIAALSEALSPELYSLLVSRCAYCSTGIRPNTHLNALNGQDVEMKIGPPPTGEIQPLNADRNVLRHVLIHGLEDNVQFGKEFSSYTMTDRGVKVCFSDGSEQEGCLLIGADGTFSRIRKQFLPEFQLFDTEARWIYGKTTITRAFLDQFQERALNGMTLVQDRSGLIPLSLLLEPMRFKRDELNENVPEDYVYWVLVSRKDNFEVSDDDLLKLSAKEVANLAKEMTANWDPSFHALFAFQDTSRTSLLRIATVKPDILLWEASSRVTLIGDAIHAMSPTSAAGATTALRDAAFLARTLSEGGINTASIHKYEEAMRKYAGEVIRWSAIGGKWLFGMQSFDELSPLAM
ncbi:Sm-like ribonucleoprotein [Penicillium atrosanguineum]|uniref:Sm-like ribonucleoprotein n=1 Tax=Penicillium atrosanguineum TaxID=1132637 RepID=UPI0023864D75|nr:Sm-like ribonucleoprotein [Penicillium atrosanguineum]KAJ5300827.1 Sm-like ribonucleoprotein [Penicillium atrosanguineum]